MFHKQTLEGSCKVEIKTQTKMYYKEYDDSNSIFHIFIMYLVLVVLTV